MWSSGIQSKLYCDRQSVGQSVLVSGTHLGPATNFFFHLEIVSRQLQVCYFIASSLTRGLVCNLLLPLVLASTVPLWSESRGTQDHILLSQFLRLPQPGVPDSRIYVPQEQGGPDIPPGTGFPFLRLLRLAGLRWRYSIPPPHGAECRRNVLWWYNGFVGLQSADLEIVIYVIIIVPYFILMWVVVREVTWGQQ
jgi:hypothetical protein